MVYNRQLIGHVSKHSKELAVAKRQQKLQEPDQKIQDALIFESARGCVLVAHGKLDYMLEDLLRAKFGQPAKDIDELIKWLFEGRGALLQSFYVKSVVARVLRLIDDRAFSALNKLNDLRNHFAHYPGEVSLTHDRVDGIYKQLDDKSKKEIEDTQRTGRHITSDSKAPQMRLVWAALALMRVLDRATQAVIDQRNIEDKKL
jgi:hypothetical protein